MKYLLFITILFSMTNSIDAQNGAQNDDPYIWLEEVEGKKALEFVDQKNKTTLDLLTNRPEYKGLYNSTLDILNAKDRIVYPSMIGEYVYNFWQDKTNERGIWRRTSKANYLTGNPTWETLLDIDKLSKEDGIKWVYKGATGLYPDYNRFLISLSNGGGDATIQREYDMRKKAFVEEGFTRPESKGGASYIDENTLIIGADFGPGTMTTSGYARQVKLWKRGTPLKDAQLIFEGNDTDVSVGGSLMRDGDKSYISLYQGMTFYTNKSFIYENGKAIKLDLPQDASFQAVLNDNAIIELKSDWIVDGVTYKVGSIINMHFPSLIKGVKKITKIYEPTEFTSVASVFTTKNHLLLNIINNVKSELYTYTFTNGKWEGKKVNTPDFGTISPISSDENSDDYFFDFQNFLTPPSLFFANASNIECKSIKSRSAYFDGSKYEVAQYKVKSKDGTMVPYFVVSAKGMPLNGQNPTLLYGYGGFEVSLQPTYSGVIGKTWLENGGVYVLSNIRGGGEFGPKWHQAGLKEKRQVIYDDFHGIAEDLIAKKITSPKHLGISGGSNGGLLVGVAFTQRPDLYNAVVCAVPLLDMKRFNHLLAGASWMGEYGDPDIAEQWAYIKKYSPYQNLKAGQKYPEVYFTTSTKDDRVHPGHARKMVAKMSDMGYKVYYFENTEGGHAGSSTNDQRARATAMQYSYLLMKLK
jgi:prolyl oligopeptidase